MKFRHTQTNLQKEREYPKLIRDLIPEIIEKRAGKKPGLRILKNNQEYQKYLLKKVLEEAEEFSKVKDKTHLVEEMADMLELFDAIIKHNKLDKKDIQKIKKEKAQLRGGFKKRILMLKNVD